MRSLFVLFVLLAACRRSDVKPEPPPKQHVEIAVAAPFVDVAQQVRDARAEARKRGRSLVVYIGATWCEPCQRFHKALESGQLDEDLAGTKFIEFDSDRDAAELRAAGYASKYIPLFSVPDQSGHASGRAIEGSVKGDGAVRENLVPRLLALLDGKPTE